MGSFIGCIPRFVKAHAGWILTALGGAGFAATVILVAKEAPEAKQAEEEAVFAKTVDKNSEYKPIDIACGLDRDWVERAELTLWEKIKVKAPVYFPAILAGTGTMACFIGAQVYNAKKQVALIGAYGMLLTQFDQYRNSVREEVGDEKEKALYISSQKKVKHLLEENERLRKENAPQWYALESLPRVIFKSRPEWIANGIMHFNRNLIMRGDGPLAELYSFFGLPAGSYMRRFDDAYMYGWNSYENEVSWGCVFTDFTIKPVTANGKTVNVIRMAIPPYRISGELEYGGKDSSTDYIYECYEANAGITEAFVAGLDLDDVYETSPTNITFRNEYLG